MIYILPMQSDKAGLQIPTYLYNFLKANDIEFDIDIEKSCLVFKSQKDYDLASNYLVSVNLIETKPKVEIIKPKDGGLF